MIIRKMIFILLAMSFIIGCSTPPEPRECVGEFRPVNITIKSDMKGLK